MRKVFFGPTDLLHKKEDFCPFSNKQDSKDLNPKPLTNAPKINSTNTPKTFNSTYASKT